MAGFPHTYQLPPVDQIQKPFPSAPLPGHGHRCSRYPPSGLLSIVLSFAVPILTICGAGVNFPGEATAATVIFGPLTFERVTGAPQSNVAKFSACDPNGTFRLVVANGEADGTHRASSATIRINGDEVLGADRFNQHVGHIELPLASLGRDNRISVEVRGQPGARVRVHIEAISHCLTVRILEPVGGARVTDRLVLVRGEVEPAEGEIGATVNGLVAPVVQGQFAILVPLLPGENRIQARVADQSGNQAEDLIVVRADLPPGEPPLDLEVYPREGLSPLTVKLRAIPREASPQGSLTVDFDGDGVAEQSGPQVDGATFTYPREGVYVLRVTQTNPDGSLATGHLVVNVIPRPDLEDKWQQMRSFLTSGDIERGLTAFLGATQKEYRRQFTALANAGALLEVANDLGNFRCNRFLPDAAECDLRVVRDGKEYSFPVIFERDADGIWRIRSF